MLPPDQDQTTTMAKTPQPNPLVGLLGAMVVGCVVGWWISIAQRVEVRSEAELASVRFGFPFSWITQDHSASAYARYPQDVALRLDGRSGLEPLPTDYDWMAFIGDALVWGALAWVLLMVGLPLVLRAIRAR